MITGICFKCGTSEGLSLVPFHFHVTPDESTAEEVAGLAGNVGPRAQRRGALEGGSAQSGHQSVVGPRGMQGHGQAARVAGLNHDPGRADDIGQGTDIRRMAGSSSGGSARFWAACGSCP